MKIGTFADSSGVEGLGFAIPSATVQEIVNQLLSQGYVSGRPGWGSRERASPPSTSGFTGFPRDCM